MDGSEQVVRVRVRHKAYPNLWGEGWWDDGQVKVRWVHDPHHISYQADGRCLVFRVPACTAPLTVEQHMRHDIGYYVG